MNSIVFRASPISFSAVGRYSRLTTGLIRGEGTWEKRSWAEISARRREKQIK